MSLINWLDLQQIGNAIVGLIIVAAAMWGWTKIKVHISEELRQWLIGWAKSLGEFAWQMGIVVAVIFAISYVFRHVGTPPPGLKIVGCPGECDDPAVKRLVSRCDLEARRYVAIMKISNIAERAKATSEDFTQCLTIEHIEVAECADQETGCLHFTD